MSSGLAACTRLSRLRRLGGLLLLVVGPVLLSCSGGDPSARFDDLVAREWAFRLEEDPLFATSVGEHRYDHLLPSVTPEDIAGRADTRRHFLTELEAIEAGALSHQDRITYAMLERELEEAIRDTELRAYELPITSESGFHTALALLPREMPFVDVEDYEAYIARLQAMPLYFDEQMARMKEGLARGFTLPAVVLDGYEVTIASHVVDEAEESVFFAPFEAFPDGVPQTERGRLVEAGRTAILENVVGAYRRFLEFMEEEYIPGCRSTVGASELPGGRAYYEHQIAVYTTLEDQSPEDLHQLGLAEVARIQAEMQAVIGEVGFDGSFREFLDFLRGDPSFYATSGQDLLEKAAYLAKTIDGKLPALFGKLPRLPYTVEPVPDHLAPKYTGGRYVPPPEGSIRPGIYWVNTYALDQRPLYVLPALTLHEAVPGHHLQMALARELEDLPPLRRHAYLSAFGEGWGLYAEWLGVEMGVYADPYTRFGRLTYEMWRACRLVVDTGMHALGWSRQQAMDYMAERTALSLHEVRTEVDRYISWPGQALAYKLGELTIRDLRREAEETLGPAFDVREFHDVVLRNGAVPLVVLQSEVRAWIAAKRGA